MNFLTMKVRKNNFLLNSLKYIGSKNSINNMLKKIADTGLNY